MRSQVRPDGQVDVRPDGGAWDRDQAAAAIALASGARVVTQVADGSAELGMLLDAGFVAARAELVISVLVPRVRTTLGAVPAPAPGITIRSVADLPLSAVHRLDLELRREVPGSEGWQTTIAEFADETFGRGFDPETYLVAEVAGRPVGLVRIWMNDDGPRAGLLGVLAPYRRTRVTPLLLRSVFDVLDARGVESVVAEVDAHNRAVTSLMQALGAQVLATNVVCTAGPRASGHPSAHRP